MIATGVVRRIDGNNRVVIPREIMRSMCLDIGSEMEIFTDDEKIVFRKYTPGCQCCKSVGVPMRSKNGINICTTCLQEMVGI